MKLPDYIEQMSVDRCAELWDLSATAVRAYKRFESVPSVLTASNIIEKSHNLVTWEGIYQPFVDHWRRINAISHQKIKACGANVRSAKK